jgi:hypothetical protein
MSTNFFIYNFWSLLHVGWLIHLFCLVPVAYRYFFRLMCQDLARWFSKRSDQFVDISDLPEKVDWQKLGKVTPISNQLNYDTNSIMVIIINVYWFFLLLFLLYKQIGTCYSFSSVEAVESTNAIKNGRLITLLKQEIFDWLWTN